MIRGAIILAVGFSLGYAKAMSEQEAVVNAADAVAKAAKELFEDLKKQQEAQDEYVTRPAVDGPEESVSDAPEADEDDEVTDPEAEQGEPS